MAVDTGIRRSAVGLIAGIPGAVLLSAAEPVLVAAVVGLLWGCLYLLAFTETTSEPIDSTVTSAAIAAPLWTLIGLTAVPLISGNPPIWSASAVVSRLPSAGFWIASGALIGFSVYMSRRFATKRGIELYTDDSFQAGYVEDDAEQILILGGGFTGLETAKTLENKFGPRTDVEITLVSDKNSILFTPMLPEVAGGALEPSHITGPLRSNLDRTRVVQAEVLDFDFGEKELEVTGVPDGEPENEGGCSTETLGYDHLVVGLGSVTNYYGMEEVEEHAFEFKELKDAILLRNHLISCFERAERVDDPAVRKRLLTFVIVGAGFSGAELAGALNDLAHELLTYYPAISRDEMSVKVVHSGDRILPELGEELADYALEKMKDRGVEFILDKRVTGADADASLVELSSGEDIEAETLVWTAGNKPNPVLEDSEVTDECGELEVDMYLRAVGVDDVWAGGDCAAIQDDETGEKHPSTAQHAMRAAKRIAENIYRTVNGEDLEPHSHTSLGQLAVIGHQVACAEVRGRRFSGLSAWLMWRLVYLWKLPGREKKLRVMFSWIVELFFPRDIVQTVDVERSGGDGR
ncbi:MAG: NAD(P)/FAD-dependent oxidoreductase [Halobacteria archaeon]